MSHTKFQIQKQIAQYASLTPAIALSMASSLLLRKMQKGEFIRDTHASVQRK